MKNGRLKRHKLILILAAVDLGLVIFVIILIFIARQKSQLVADLSQQAGVLSQKQNSLGQLESFSMDSQKVIDALFLNDKTKAAVIDQLESLGATAGVNYTLNNAIDHNGLKYDITVEGRFADIYQFIFLVENLPYEASVNTVSLGKILDAKGQGELWSANLVINVANLNTP